jgi:raffinose/stachyose/melibiose transport system permease protein
MESNSSLINTRRVKWNKVFIEIFMIGFTCVFLYPLAFALFVSLKEAKELYSNPLWIPSEFAWENYRIAWYRMGYPRALFNTVVITVSSLISIVVVASLAAYPLARFNIRLNQIMYVVFLAIIMVPYQTVMVPLVKQFYSLGLVNNYLSMVIFYTASAPGTPFAVFLFVGFMRTLPRELEEAAVMDGCTPFQVFSLIVIPLIRPAIVTVLIIGLMWTWNSFLMPLILLPSEKVMPLTPKIGRFFEEFNAQWTHAFAGAVMTMLPGIVAYFFLQKHFIKGLTAGAIK